MASGEFEFISGILRMFDVPAPRGFEGFGDDCAVIGKRLVTTDILVENVHFIRRLIPLKLLGRKALAVNLSDIAADGGIAEEFYLTIARPADLQDQALMQLVEGLAEIAAEYDVPLMGGDTTSSKSGLIISVTVIGSAPHGAVTRNGARAGDKIAVTGNIGDSALGLSALLTEFDYSVVEQQYPGLAAAHCDPRPGLKEGVALAEAGVSAMMDISDGLLGDLGHILEMSQVGADVYLEKIPLSLEYRVAAEKYASEFYEPALTGGEDYELLFTFAANKQDKISSALAEIDASFTVIGEIVPGPPRARVFDGSGKVIKFKAGGWDHFKIG